MSEIRVPQLGESVVEATVARWVKQQGDHVEVGDAVVELETEKVNVEVAAEASGILQQVLHEEGATVNVGEVLAIIGTGAPAAQQTVGDAEQQAKSTPPAEERQDAHAPSPEDGPRAAETVDSPAADVHITPVARRLAEEHGIDPQALTGSGPGGRVVKEDIMGLIERGPQAAAPAPGETPPAAKAPPPGPAFRHSAGPAAGAPADPAPPAPATERQSAPRPPAAPPAPTPAPAPQGEGRPEERVRLSRRRLTIARRLVEAQQTAAMLTTFNEVDMSAVMEVRKRRRDQFKERHGVSLGFMSFFTKAVVGALKAFPPVNAELQGEELILKQYYDIGIAVSTEEGLVVPVLRDADRLSFAGIEQGIMDLATRARERRLSLDELRGGTFTITNGGIFGSLLSTPILNPPQVGILGMHKIEERPIALNGQVVIRPMMYLALTYDHRVVDGREAVTFLVRIKELIEDPERLLLEG